MSQPI